ncbi:hypothetical protein MMC13_007496 [Lambiella insularis]|nr:hypothetical protein [Lambiella insularis]
MTTYKNWSDVSPVVCADALLVECHKLLNELEEFQAFLTEQKKDHTADLRQFRSSVNSELRSLERLSVADPTAERTVHTLRSSNLPFYIAVWATAKSIRGLVLFNKRFYWETPAGRPAEGGPKPRCKYSALVDIVAEDGAEWIKVSTVSESRILFEKAKAGWEAADSDSSTEDDFRDGARIVADGGMGHEASGSGSDGNDNRIELLRVAEDLQKAAKKVRVRYHHPRVRFVLPKIMEGKNAAIDAILGELRATGATVQCGSLPSRFGAYTNGVTSPTQLTTLFTNLLIDPLAHLTPVLNIDCTILLALVSDLSHTTLAPSPTLHKAIRRQVDLEADEKLLPSNLYPTMAGRSLVCTLLAAKRMREIVEQIGTATERLRTELLLGQGKAGKGKTSEELRESFGAFSDYEIPDTWKLPIQIEARTYELSSLPVVAKKVEAELTEINRSVFLYGWENGLTTISSNRTVAKVIEGIVEAEGGEDDEGPKVWLCSTARSLVGKEKARR